MDKPAAQIENTDVAIIGAGPAGAAGKSVV